MKMLITMMMFLTGLTIMTTHPLMMSMIILILAILIAMLTSMLTIHDFLYTFYNHNWSNNSYIYLHNKLNFKQKIKLKKINLIYWTLIVIFMFYNSNTYFINQTYLTNQIMNMNNMKLESCMSKFINYPLSMMMLSQ